MWLQGISGARGAKIGPPTALRLGVQSITKDGVPHTGWKTQQIISQTSDSPSLGANYTPLQTQALQLHEWFPIQLHGDESCPTRSLPSRPELLKADRLPPPRLLLAKMKEAKGTVMPLLREASPLSLPYSLPN